MLTNHKLTVITLEIDQIEPFRNNPRIHPAKQIEMLESGIKKFGFNNPVLVAEPKSSSGAPSASRHELIAGHARLIAARNIGMMSVPAIILPHLKEDQRRAYRVADNAIMLKGEWSLDLLKVELAFQLDFDVEFDAGALGFEIGEVDAVVLPTNREHENPLEETPDRSEPPVSQKGIIWSVGPHRIICGDALDPETWERLMAGRLADAVVSDMPFNVPVAGHVSGSGKFDEFAMASGEMNREDFSRMISKALSLQARHSSPGSLSYQFIDWRSVDLMIAGGHQNYEKLVNLCVWVKPAAGMGSFYRSQHELICVFRKAGSSHRNNVELGKHGRYRTNVWNYEGCTGFSSDRTENLAMHPTVKNTDMIADAIMDSTAHGDLVVDAFLGSGTTIIAAARSKRCGYGIELDPHYVDVAVKRVMDLTGEIAIDQNGRSFTDALAIDAAGKPEICDGK